MSGVLWAHRNTPHENTGESHLSYSLAWIVEPPLEAALLPPTQVMPTEVEDYQEEVILFLPSEQKLDSKSNTKSTEAIQDPV